MRAHTKLIVIAGYCIWVLNFYPVLHSLRCRKSSLIIDLSSNSHCLPQINKAINPDMDLTDNSDKLSFI